MKIYIASSWKNQVAVIALAEYLERYSFEVDAFCRSSDKRYSFHWSELVDDEEDLANYDAIAMLADPRTQRAFNEDKGYSASCLAYFTNCDIVLLAYFAALFADVY